MSTSTSGTALPATRSAPPSDVASFADLGVPQQLVTALTRAGITEPFPIQAATIPDALTGRDVLGRGRTGSGKTLAFGLPVAHPAHRPGRAAAPAARRRPGPHP